MSKAFPERFFYSISQANLREAATQVSLPGKSRFHLDPERRAPGVWLTDQLSFAFRNKYGLEQSDESLGTVKIGSKIIDVKKPILPIILEFRELDEKNLLQHPLLPDQFFHVGDIDWSKVRAFLVADKDKETEAIARTLAEDLGKRGHVIEISFFRPQDLPHPMESTELKINEMNLKDLDGGGENKF